MREGSLAGRLAHPDRGHSPLAALFDELEGRRLHLARSRGEDARKRGPIVDDAALPERRVLVVGEARVLVHQALEVLAGELALKVGGEAVVRRLQVAALELDELG